MNTQPRTLDDLGVDARYLESCLGFDRWATGPEDSVWACGDCGSIIDATEHGCHACGRGVELDPEEEARQWA